MRLKVTMKQEAEHTAMQLNVQLADAAWPGARSKHDQLNVKRACQASETNADQFEDR